MQTQIGILTSLNIFICVDVSGSVYLLMGSMPRHLKLVLVSFFSCQETIKINLELLFEWYLGSII